MASFSAPADDQKAIRMHASQSGSIFSAPPTTITKAEKPEADKKKLAKEQAAQREQLLHSRNAAYVINYLEKRTHFDAEQIKSLQRIYKRFKGKYPMDRLRFREMVASLLGITDNMMLDRIFQAFDGDNEGSVSEAEWIIGLSVQLRGNLEQQIAYTYDVYDVNGDRSIGREEITSFYKNSVYAIKGIMEADEVDDAINELVELAMKKFDIDKDGNISYSEYRHAVRKDPLLLEAFGQCMPQEQAAVPTVALLDLNERNFTQHLSKTGDPSWSSERERYRKFQFDQLDTAYFANANVEPPLSWTAAGAQNQPRKSHHNSVHSFKPNKLGVKNVLKSTRKKK